MKCGQPDCEAEGTHSITVNIPAEGVPIDLHRPIKMYMGIELCLDHAKMLSKEFDWEENHDLRNSIDEALVATSATKADYERTFTCIVKVTDPGYLQFLEFMRKRGEPV